MKFVSTKKFIITLFLLLDPCLLPFTTARKRSLRRLCFHRGLSVHMGAGSATGEGGLHRGEGSLHPDGVCIQMWVCIQMGVCIQGALHPERVCIQGGGGLHPGGLYQRGLHLGGLGRPPSIPLDTMGCSQQAGETHPTGMHSCLFIYLFCWGCLRNAKPINCHFQCITSKFP